MFDSGPDHQFSSDFQTLRNGTEPSKRTSKRKHEIYTGYGKHLQHRVTGDFKHYNFL